MSANLTSLTAPTEVQLREIGSAEILVGIPSYNNADTVGHVVRAVSVGLAKHFPDRRAVLVNSDGGSSDGTPAIVARTAIDCQYLFIGDQQSIILVCINNFFSSCWNCSVFCCKPGICR